MCVSAKLLQLCPTLCDPMDYSPPGSHVSGILQARILEWVAMPSSREGTGYTCQYSLASLVAQLVKNLPAVWETWVQFLGWEDPLEKG